MSEEANQLLTEIRDLQREILVVQKDQRDQHRRFFLLYRGLTLPIFILIGLLMLHVVVMIVVTW